MKGMWDVPGDCSENCGFFLFSACPSPSCPVSPLPFSQGPVCASKQLFIPQLPHHLYPRFLITVSPLSLFHGNTAEIERLGPAISEHFSFPEVLALAACGNSYLRLVQNTSFFVFLWDSLIGGL